MNQSQNMPLNILMVYIEPTPYIVGLIHELRIVWPGKIDVLFLTENKSQHWNMTRDEKWFVLPIAFKDKIKFIYQIFFTKRYDSIHLAGWGHPLLLLFIFLSILKKLPIAIESDTPIHQQTKRWKKLIKRLIYPMLFRWVNIFLPGGIRQAKYFEYYGVNQEKIFPVNMTVDVSGMQREAEKLTDADRRYFRNLYHVEDHSVVFLFVGRLVNHKGLLDLLEIFCQSQHIKAKLFIVGDGPLKHVFNEASFKKDNICYLGRLSGPDLIRAYLASDVLVLPSYFEPWGLVVNEAMALGLPVIVSDCVGCIDDLVHHEETGWIVKTACMKSLQQAILFFIKETAARLAMGEASKKKINNWTLENEAIKICQAWRQLVHA